MDEIPLDLSKTSISCSVTESQPLCTGKEQDSDETFEKLSTPQSREYERKKSLRNKETSKVVVDAEFEVSMAPQSSSAAEYIDDNKRLISDKMISFKQKEFETRVETERFGQQNAEPVQTSSYQANEELETTSVSDYSKPSTSTSVNCSELTPDNRQDFQALTRNLASEISSILTELHSIVSKDILCSKPPSAGATCGELAERKALQNLTKRLTKEILSKLKELCSAISEDLLYTEPLTSAGESCNDPFTDTRENLQASTRNLANEILSKIEALRSSVSENILFSKPSSAVGTLSDPAIRKELHALTRNLANEILSKVEEYHSSKSEEIMYSEPSTSAGTSCSNTVPDNRQDFQASIRNISSEISSKLDELHSIVSKDILYSKPPSAVAICFELARRKALQVETKLQLKKIKSKLEKLISAVSEDILYTEPLTSAGASCNDPVTDISQEFPASTRNLANEIVNNLEGLFSSSKHKLFSKPSTSAGANCSDLVPDIGQDFQATIIKLGNRKSRKQDKLHSEVSEDKLYSVDSTSAEVSPSVSAIRKSIRNSTKKLENVISSKLNKNISEGFKKPRLTCKRCGKSCTNNSEYRSHALNHRGDFKCKVCSNCYSTDGLLKKHMWQMHTGKKLLLCTKCEFRCARKSSLRRHMKVHSKKKPFKCSICFKRFKYKSCLKRHEKKHKKNDKKIVYNS